MGRPHLKVFVTHVEAVARLRMVSGTDCGFSGFLVLVFGGGYFFGPRDDIESARRYPGSNPGGSTILLGLFPLKLILIVAATSSHSPEQDRDSSNHGCYGY